MEISKAPRNLREKPMSAYEGRREGVWKTWCDQIAETCSLAQLEDVVLRMEDAADAGNLPPGWLRELKHAADQHREILKEQE